MCRRRRRRRRRPPPAAEASARAPVENTGRRGEHMHAEGLLVGGEARRHAHLRARLAPMPCMRRVGGMQVGMHARGYRRPPIGHARLEMRTCGEHRAPW